MLGTFIKTTVLVLCPKDIQPQALQQRNSFRWEGKEIYFVGAYFELCFCPYLGNFAS